VIDDVNHGGEGLSKEQFHGTVLTRIACDDSDQLIFAVNTVGNRQVDATKIPVQGSVIGLTTIGQDNWLNFAFVSEGGTELVNEDVTSTFNVTSFVGINWWFQVDTEGGLV